MARGGAPHKHKIIVSKLLEASRNGTQALRGAERRWVRWGGAGRHTNTKSYFFGRRVESAPFESFFEIIVAHVSLSTTDV